MTISASFGPTVLQDSVNMPTFGYQQITYNVLATAATTDVRFGFLNEDSFFDLDDVSLTPIPEPASLACLTIGGLLVGGREWRKRRAFLRAVV